jgi:hypothetical protein
MGGTPAWMLTGWYTLPEPNRRRLIITLPDPSFDPLARKAQADLIVERAAEQLRRVVRELVAQLDPFPPFPGALFSYGIEVEPEAAARTDRGCIVLGPDAEFYEFEIGVDPEGLDPSGYLDPVALRHEEMTKLTLHPRDVVVYAHSAITRVTEILLERIEDADRSAGGPPRQ